MQRWRSEPALAEEPNNAAKPMSDIPNIKMVSDVLCPLDMCHTLHIARTTTMKGHWCVARLTGTQIHPHCTSTLMYRCKHAHDDAHSHASTHTHIVTTTHTNTHCSGDLCVCMYHSRNSLLTRCVGVGVARAFCAQTRYRMRRSRSWAQFHSLWMCFRQPSKPSLKLPASMASAAVCLDGLLSCECALCVVAMIMAVTRNKAQ